jgi:hypothetical protein
LDRAPQVRISDAGKRGHSSGRGACEPVAVVFEKLGGLPAMEEMKLSFRMVCNFLIHPENLVFQSAFE